MIAPLIRSLSLLSTWQVPLPFSTLRRECEPTKPSCPASPPVPPRGFFFLFFPVNSAVACRYYFSIFCFDDRSVDAMNAACPFLLPPLCPVARHWLVMKHLSPLPAPPPHSVFSYEVPPPSPTLLIVSHEVAHSSSPPPGLLASAPESSALCPPPMCLAFSSCMQRFLSVKCSTLRGPSVSALADPSSCRRIRPFLPSLRYPLPHRCIAINLGSFLLPGTFCSL